jgi:hypothetical protein
VTAGSPRIAARDRTQAIFVKLFMKHSLCNMFLSMCIDVLPKIIFFYDSSKYGCISKMTYVACVVKE